MRRAVAGLGRKAIRVLTSPFRCARKCREVGLPLSLILPCEAENAQRPAQHASATPGGTSSVCPSCRGLCYQDNRKYGYTHRPCLSCDGTGEHRQKGMSYAI
jgi:hypothetical protein